MCFLKKDFVVGYCKFCKLVSAQIYRQRLCWDSFDGWNRHTSGWYNDPRTERYEIHDGLLPTDFCTYAAEGQDPAYAFWGDPPKRFGMPLVHVPDEEYWAFLDEMPQEKRKGWDPNAPCIRCDLVYGELNWWWFYTVLVDRDRLQHWPTNRLYRYVEGIHQGNPRRKDDERSKLELIQLPGSVAPFATVMMHKKPRSYKPSEEFLHGFPHDHRSPLEVVKEMRFELLDLAQDRLVAEDRNLFEGRCAGRTDEEGEYGMGETLPAPEDTDQQVAFMNGIDYDHTDGEFEEFVDDNHREAHRWDRGGYWWEDDGTALRIPPQAVNDDSEPDDTYSDHDPEAYSDGIDDLPRDDLSAQMASVHLDCPDYAQDDEYFGSGADGSYVVHEQQQPYDDTDNQNYQNPVDYDGYHPGGHSDNDDDDDYLPDPSHWHM